MTYSIAELDTIEAHTNNPSIQALLDKEVLDIETQIGKGTVAGADIAPQQAQASGADNTLADILNKEPGLNSGLEVMGSFTQAVANERAIAMQTDLPSAGRGGFERY